MTTVVVSDELQASTDTVWHAMSDFGGIKVGGPITSFETEGQGVGMVRKIGMGGGLVIERLDVHDKESHTFAYAIINDDSPLPVQNYAATVVITPTGHNACRVDWTGTFDPRGEESVAIKTVEGIYKGGIARAKTATGG